MEVHKSVITLALAGITATLFVVDFFLPFGVAAGIPYVLVVLVAAWLPSARMPFYMAGLSSVLIIAGAFLSPEGGVTWMGLVNRVMGIAVLWITAILILMRRRTEERLRRVNRELDAFVHTVSHDLRSPLSPILGFAEYLRDEYGHCLGEDGRDALHRIEGQGRRMHALLDDLLQLAMAGSIERPPAPVDVEHVVRQVLENWMERAAEAGCELRCGELPKAAIPESLLAQIFDNLVGNAVHYASGGPIEIDGERAGDRCRYYVRDHGPGILPEERETIFETFVRGSAGRSVPGTGIGLATVRKVADHFDGRVWVEETPGGGSTFWVELVEPPR